MFNPQFGFLRTVSKYFTHSSAKRIAQLENTFV